MDGQNRGEVTAKQTLFTFFFFFFCNKCTCRKPNQPQGAVPGSPEGGRRGQQRERVTQAQGDLEASGGDMGLSSGKTTITPAFHENTRFGVAVLFLVTSH